MKSFFKIIVLFFVPLLSAAQPRNIDSLRNSFANAATDSARYEACKFMYDHYEETNRDSAFHFAEEALFLAKENNKRLAQIHSLNNRAYQLIGLGRYAESLQDLLEAFKIVENPSIEKEKTWILFTASPAVFSGNNRLLMLAYTHHIFGILMRETQNTEQEIIHFKEARRIASGIGHPVRQMMACMNLGRAYMVVNKLDSALSYEKEAEHLTSKANFKKYLGQVYMTIGSIYDEKNNREQAIQYYRKGLQVSKEENNLNALNSTYFFLTKHFIATGEKDSALHYALLNLQSLGQLGTVRWFRVNQGTIYENVYLAYKMRNQTDSVVKYLGLTLLIKDSLYKTRINNLTAFQNVTLNEQMRLQDAEKNKIAYQNKIRTYFLLAGIGVLLLLAIIFYWNNRQKHKAKLKIEKAYDDLKATQQQLIQAEKMASLGELTAGIAHEIQNPLNFVNNFSEVSNELIDEMKTEVVNGNVNGAFGIAEELKQNLEKINHHGKRADSIVKGMLQHSRSSSGQKEPTDINALADEYFRLAYHGLRAKDRTFNATTRTEFDDSIEKINVVPQDIGKVILNLINNAFYAVNEKQRQNLNGYQPAVAVTTTKQKARPDDPVGRDKVEIKVKDNGNGIPGAIKGKIFQPFFTTKPTGQGTGLGLSLSYDIIKAHGGELIVNSKEGEGSEFIMTLPS